MNIDQLRTDPTTRYVGDGVYARHDGYQLWLHVSNGLDVTASIALCESTFVEVSRYVDTVIKSPKCE